MSTLIENLCVHERNIKDSCQAQDENEADMLNQKDYLEHIIAVNNLDVAYLNGLKGFFELLSLSDEELSLKKEELAILLRYTHAQRRLNIFKSASAALDRYIQIDHLKLSIEQEMLQKAHDDFVKKALNDLFVYSTVEHYQDVINHYKKEKNELTVESQDLLSQIEKKDALLSNIDYMFDWIGLRDERFALFVQLREVQFNEKIVDSIIFKIEELKTQASPEKGTFSGYLKQLGYA